MLHFGLSCEHLRVFRAASENLEAPDDRISSREQMPLPFTLNKRTCCRTQMPSQESASASHSLRTKPSKLKFLPMYIFCKTQYFCKGTRKFSHFLTCIFGTAHKCLLAKILCFAVGSVLYHCARMNRRAFTVRPTVVIISISIINIITTATICLSLLLSSIIIMNTVIAASNYIYQYCSY